MAVWQNEDPWPVTWWANEWRQDVDWPLRYEMGLENLGLDGRGARFFLPRRSHPLERHLAVHTMHLTEWVQQQEEAAGDAALLAQRSVTGLREAVCESLDLAAAATLKGLHEALIEQLCTAINRAQAWAETCEAAQRVMADAKGEEGG